MFFKFQITSMFYLSTFFTSLIMESIKNAFSSITDNVSAAAENRKKVFNMLPLLPVMILLMSMKRLQNMLILETKS